MHSFPVIIREALNSDFKQLCKLFLEENRFHAELVPEYIQTTSEVLTQEELQTFIASSTGCLFVCEHERKLLGAVIVSLKEERENRWKKARLVGYIEDLVVTSTACGRGIGKRLLDEARKWVLSHGVQTIELHVWERNVGARSFYASLGLKDVQRRMRWNF